MLFASHAVTASLIPGAFFQGYGYGSCRPDYQLPFAQKNIMRLSSAANSAVRYGNWIIAGERKKIGRLICSPVPVPLSSGYCLKIGVL